MHKAYKARNRIRAYKSSWSRKHGHRRVLRRLGTIVYAQGIKRIHRSDELHIAMYIANHGGHFWSTKCKELVHRCRWPTKKAHQPARIKERRRRLEQQSLGPREYGEVPSGWDLY